ncbi:hypothetical protein SLEP1_g54108 [Rubroshorea leprosula]|uniref:Uncharacterized protein n=1 Tax=Rubroshorea leprosula TaxID=152421 RepID=A0AAV5MCF9_9ROSI|nr:hypothetical protein SLEP1_g54108 [Rubroshorea leprosula]
MAMGIHLISGNSLSLTSLQIWSPSCCHSPTTSAQLQQSR